MAAAAEDALLRRVLRVALDSGQTGGDAADVSILDGIAEELRSEGAPLLLTSDSLDRVIVARLIESPPAGQALAPFPYLLACFARAASEARSLVGDAAAQQQLAGALKACRDLLVSYAGLILSGSGVVPEPEPAARRGALQLLDALDARDGTMPEPVPGLGQAVALPHGFLEELAAQQDTETLGAILGPVVKQLARRVQAASPMGQYAAPLAAIRQLVGIEPAARALVALPSFLPDLGANTGRALELPGTSWLGPCFSPSPVPDPHIKAQPSVRAQCFAGLSSGRGRVADANSHLKTLRMAQAHIAGELAAIVKALLGKATRARMLAWLAAAVEGNKERGKMQMNLDVAASHGFFLNLNAVLLKLCGPFLDPSSGAFWKRVDWRYVPLGQRLSFADDTKLAVTQQQEAAWIEQERVAAGAAGAAAAGSSSEQQQQQQPGNGSAAPTGEDFHFICEAFFLTLKALHYGYVRCIDYFVEMLSPAYQRARNEVELTQERLEASAGSPAAQLLQLQLDRANAVADDLLGMVYCFEAALGDSELVVDMLALYRLMAAWLLSLVQPGGAFANPQLPLPDLVPPSWALLPEWFVEDLAEVLVFLTRFQPQLLASNSGGCLDSLMLFMVVFIASPAYLRNAHLRSRLGDVLHAWLPQTQAASFKRARTTLLDSTMAPLFEVHPVVRESLVPALINLYSDVEATDRANAFYAKFNARQGIANVLLYCWQIPAHREVWRRYAALDGGRGAYLRFANMLINDSIYLLDEALKYIKELRALEAELAAPAPMSEARSERLQAHQQLGGHVSTYLFLASGTINTLAVTTTEVTGSFLLPEMVERLAAMLNYFLLYLTGPERKSLKLKDPDKYNFKPKELLAQICTIYLNMAAADKRGVFAAAIAADARSYRPAMFSEASLVLRQFGLLGEGHIQLLESLAGQVAQLAVDAQVEEEVLGEVPDEFMDPIQYTLMKDPVLLPTSGTVMDRATILRHLLTDERDPINRAPLKVEDLQPAAELRGRIRAWLAEQRAQRAAAGGAAGGAPMES